MFDETDNLYQTEVVCINCGFRAYGTPSDKGWHKTHHMALDAVIERRREIDARTLSKKLKRAS